MTLHIIVSSCQVVYVCVEWGCMADFASVQARPWGTVVIRIW